MSAATYAQHTDAGQRTGHTAYLSCKSRSVDSKMKVSSMQVGAHGTGARIPTVDDQVSGLRYPALLALACSMPSCTQISSGIQAHWVDNVRGL